MIGAIPKALQRRILATTPDALGRMVDLFRRAIYVRPGLLRDKPITKAVKNHSLLSLRDILSRCPPREINRSQKYVFIRDAGHLPLHLKIQIVLGAGNRAASHTCIELELIRASHDFFAERLSPVTRCRERAPKPEFEVEHSLHFLLAAGSALICDDLFSRCCQGRMIA
jgi:hypothetical protein